MVVGHATPVKGWMGHGEGTAAAVEEQEERAARISCIQCVATTYMSEDNAGKGVEEVGAIVRGGHRDAMEVVKEEEEE